MWDLNQIQELIKDVPDFPKQGVVFKDISDIFLNHEAFVSLARQIARIIPPEVEKLVAIESRGFILASAVAQHLNVGMVMMRKPGKLPRETVSHSYELEYGTDTLEVHKDAINPGDKVIIIDDVLATGGTAEAAYELCQKLGAEVIGFEIMMEIKALNGASKLKAPLNSLFVV